MNLCSSLCVPLKDDLPKDITAKIIADPTGMKHAQNTLYLISTSLVRRGSSLS